jgi:molecular chaperone GrpE
MELKKAKKADLEKRKGTFLEIGLVLALSIILVAFEWTKGEGKDDNTDVVSEIQFEDEMMQITRREEPKPEPKLEQPKIAEVLDIVDNFERALDAEHEESAYANGVRLIYDQLQNLLRRREVVPMNTMGTPFNPEMHDALLHVHSDDMADGLVCQVIKQGYEYRGRVLRPAQVAVSRGPNPANEGQSDTDAVSTDAAEAEDSK